MDKPLPTQTLQKSLHGLRPAQELGELLPAIHLVRTSWIVRLIGKFTFALLAISLVAMFFLPWQQTARGNGAVIALNPQERPQTVGAQQDGVIKSVGSDLREGSEVKEGQVILEVEPFAPEQVGQLRAQIQQYELKREAHINELKLAEQNISLQASVGTNLVLAAENEVEAARQKHKQQMDELEVIKADLQQKIYEKNQADALYPKGLISELEMMEKRNGLVAAQNKLQKGQAQVGEFISTLNAKEDDLASKRQDVQIKNAQTEAKAQEEKQKLAMVEKELTDLKIKEGELGRLKITSPVDGILQTMYSIEGANTVKKGDSLFVVVPKVTELAVTLSVPGRDMPLVQVGDKVRLQFQGWPAVQFVGWPSVAVGTFGGQIAALSPTDDTRGDFSVLVVPDPEEPAWPDNRYLRQGVRTSGWILLRQVSLGYEIWRQLNGFPPVISDQEPNKGTHDKSFEGKSKIKLPKS
ncbi:MAG: efflux RND transporter periplasmic adaptor subunit [Pirellulaceae bacterium]|nr:efflux RND transporter periplasmic adaptor subunit [Pirellulaceae bacterium]